MLKKYLKPSIICLIQGVLLALLIFCLAPVFLENTNILNHWRIHFQHLKWLFLSFHGTFYVCIWFGWPLLVRLIVSKRECQPSDTQFKIAIQARYYLIGALIILEALSLLR